MSDSPKPPVSLTSITGTTFTNAQLDAMYDLVVSGPKAQNPTMRESTFRDYFLPVLAGAVDDPERLRIYIQGAAGFNVGLNIVDDAGNFMYEVPPVFGSDHIKPLPEDENTPTYNTILEHVQLMRFRSPSRSEEMLRQGLTARMVHSHKKGYLPTANEKKWIAIFAHYGYDVKSTILSKEEYYATIKSGTANPGTNDGSGNTQPSKPDDDIEIIGEY